MACSITITEVVGIGLPGGVPTSIRVRGTATDCKEVTVIAYCHGTPFSGTTSVAADGSWTADLVAPRNSGCQCGGKIVVQAVCADDVTCTASGTAELKCQPPEGCPSVVLDVESGSCNADGTRNVTLTATITPASTTPGVAQLDFGDASVGAAFVFTGAITHTETHTYTIGGPYTAQLLIILPEGCPPTPRVVGPLSPCPCPEVQALGATVMGCAGGGASASVSFSGTVPAGLTGCTYHWDFGDGSPDVVTAGPTTAHVYTSPGTFSAAVTLVCGDCIRTTTVSVVIPPCCPIVMSVASSIDPAANCADGTGRSATVTFTATTDPLGAPGSFTWTFDDGTGPVTTTAPVVVHSYTSPGTKTVQVTFTPIAPGCPSSIASTTVNVPSCGVTPPTVPTPPSSEGGGCTGLRWAAVILAILATLSLYICLCVPGASPAFCWAALGLAAGSAILLAIWAIFCPRKPCMWGLLIAWQIALGAGIGALYFAPCCPWLWAVGAGLIATGLAGLIVWARECRKASCQVLAEVAVVITVVIIPVINWLGLIPLLAACLNPWVEAAVATLSGVIVVALAKCAMD